MERVVASAPQPRSRPSCPPSVSPLAVSSPSSMRSISLPPVPFSAIQSSSDANEEDDAEARNSDLIPPLAHMSIPDSDMLSERQLIARGRVLLQAYQSQKKQWLQIGEYGPKALAPGSADSTVNIFQPVMDSNGEYSTSGYSSPTNRAVAHLTTVDAPSINTKLKEFSPPPPPSSPPPSSLVSGLSNFSIGPLPTSELKMNQPLSGNRSEKSWTDFMALLKTNGHMMDTVDAQLAEIWSELVSADESARGPQTSVDKLSEAVTQLLQQKREAEIAIAKLAEVLGSRVFLSGKMSDDTVQFVSNQLRLELEASQVLVEKVKAEKITYTQKELTAVIGTSRSDAIAELLHHQLQDKEEQLQASQAAVAKLKDQLVRQKETASDRQAQLERALDVKLREIDALCNDVDLPLDYERVKTTEGIACYRRKGVDGDNKLEDPRVPIAIQHRLTTASAATATDRVATPTSNEITSSGSTHRPRGISAMTREYTGLDNIMRRSFSTPHISHDNVFEDIHVPPDDGRKHTIEDFSTPLPAGWEMRVTASGAVFFFNKYTTTTTWTDPRLLGTASASSAADNSNILTEQKPLVRNASAVTSESRPSRSNSTAVNADAPQSVLREEEAGVKYLDVVFEESGPIGIHFQANVPDAGATVRSLLPDMAAATKNVLEPFDELVAVNKNAVDTAPFRHVMLLLQGGLRPLMLTFKRDLNRPQRPMPPLTGTPSSDGGSSLVSGSDFSDTHLDEEVLIDEGTVVDLEQLRVPLASSRSESESHTVTMLPGGEEDEDMNVADVIITNIFSLFWKPPETTGEVQTV